MYFVYVLYSPSLNKFYTGQTKDLLKRLEHHNLGINKWSRRGVPWAIVYSEQVMTRGEAIKRESYLKSGAGKLFIRGQIKKLS